MTTLDDVRQLAATEQGLCVVATTRADGSVHASVVNAGIMAHPITGEPTLAFVARAQAHKVGLIRATGRASITFRRQWRWAGAEGPAHIIEGDNPEAGIVLAPLLRQVFEAAGGTHDDWDTFDRVMAEEQRLAVFVAPVRLIGQA